MQLDNPKTVTLTWVFWLYTSFPTPIPMYLVLLFNANSLGKAPWIGYGNSGLFYI